MRAIIVELRESLRSYPIMLENGLLDAIGGRMKGLGLGGRCAVITNPTVRVLYLKRVLDSLFLAGLSPFSIEIPDGEEYKTLGQVETIYDRLVGERFERRDTIVTLGGGVIGDIGGFTAATFLRGVPYVHAPTTLLAQVDSSVGGKTGVNHPLGKNLIGAFYQPNAVFIDPQVLTTLPERELRAGLSEVVKYGVIWDKGFFRFIEDNIEGLLIPPCLPPFRGTHSAGNPPEGWVGSGGDGGGFWISVIERSCKIKAGIVEKDEREGTGLRAILNFGHTFAHALEVMTGYKRFKHGEAVSIGMVMASMLSVRLGIADSESVLRLKALLSALGLPTAPPEFRSDDFLSAMRLDKKVRGGSIRCVLLKDIGEVIFKEVEEARILDFLQSGEKDVYP